MKKMFYFVFAFVATLLFVPSVSALAPEYNLQMGTEKKEVFLANGNAITITADPDNANGAIITWADGSQKVTKAVTIFGGAHDSEEELASTSITMNGGIVKNIMGGGLHVSGVDNANIVINGGKVTGSIMGGGYHGFLSDDDYTTKLKAYTAADAKTSKVYVKNAFITVNGGDLDGVMIFGGGGGYNRVDATYIIIGVNNQTPLPACRAGKVRTKGENRYDYCKCERRTDRYSSDRTDRAGGIPDRNGRQRHRHHQEGQCHPRRWHRSCKERQGDGRRCRFDHQGKSITDCRSRC